MKPQFIERHEKIGMLIAFYRRKRKLTQKELGATVGIEPKHISGIENARIGMSLDMLFMIADALGIEPWKLLNFSILEDE